MNNDLHGLRNHKFFRILIKQIEEHPFKKELGALHSSLVVKGGSIIGIGLNKPFPNSLGLKYAQHDGWQTHSECSAILEVKNKKKLRGSTLYNCRIDKDGKLEISKPCKGCFKMLKDFEVKKVYFSKRTGIGCVKVW